MFARRSTYLYTGLFFWKTLVSLCVTRDGPQWYDIAKMDLIRAMVVGCMVMTQHLIMSPVDWVSPCGSQPLWLPASVCFSREMGSCVALPLGAPVSFHCLNIGKGSIEASWKKKKKLQRDNDLHRWQCQRPPRCFGWCSLGAEDSHCRSQSWSGQDAPWEKGVKVRRYSAGLCVVSG